MVGVARYGIRLRKSFARICPATRGYMFRVRRARSLRSHCGWGSGSGGLARFARIAADGGVFLSSCPTTAKPPYPASSRRSWQDIPVLPLGGVQKRNILPVLSVRGMILRFCRSSVPQNRHILPIPLCRGMIFRLCRTPGQQKRKFLPTPSCRGGIFRLCGTPQRQNRHILPALPARGMILRFCRADGETSE